MGEPSLRPLLWMSPALAGGGYSSESIAFAMGLANLPSLSGSFALRNFAEQPSYEFIAGLPEQAEKALIAVLDQDGSFDKRLRRRKGIVICHSTPDAWVPSKFPGWDELAPCPPASATYTIGRTMFETDSMPSDWVARCNAMDEIWVPTDFHQATFAAAGVTSSKLHVVGEPVDTAFFDPAAHAPMRLSSDVKSAAAVSTVQRPFRFLSVFKWERRKGWDALLQASVRASTMHASPRAHH